MLQIVIEQRSVDNTLAYVERVKLRIFAQMKLGMQEAMQGLAGEAVAQASAAGIQARTGQLFADILRSPSVSENSDLIFGSVSPKSEMTIGGRKFEGFLGTALDEGFVTPSTASPGRKIDSAQGDSKVFAFITSSGSTRYTFGHGAIRVRPHPFLRRSKESFAAQIMQIIATRVAEAYE
jgi:hypothetical protein